MADRRRLLSALPILLGVASFGAGLGGGFVLDDRRAILGNPVVTGAAPLAAAFTHTFWGEPLGQGPPSYRPLASLSFRLDHALAGLSPGAFHLSSLLWYLAALLLLQRLARVWLEPGPACLAACLFAVMPTHAEVVASLVGRADTLALLGALAALLALRPALEGRPLSRARLWGACAAYVAALLCKESAALLPLVVAALVPVPAPGIDRGWRRHGPAAALAGCGAAYLLARTALLPEALGGYAIPDDVVAGASAAQHATYSLELLARYARLLAAPIELCTGRKYAMVARPERLLSPPALAGALLLALIAWRTVVDRRRRRPPFALAALLSWLLFASLAFPVPEAMADRFLLTPSLFVALAAAGGLWAWGRSAWPRGALVGLLLAAQLALSAFFALQWRSTFTLLRHGVLACPDAIHNQVRFADELSRAGDHAEAAWRFAVAAEGRRRFPRPWHHPAVEAELTLSAPERLARMHTLLRVAAPEGPWRRALAGALAARGQRAEAEWVTRTSPVPLGVQAAP